jgi:hypothetical protein
MKHWSWCWSWISALRKKLKPVSKISLNSTSNCLLHFFIRVLLVFLVNDSEYSKSAGTKSILPPGCMYLVSSGALRAPTPPHPPFGGKGKYQKSPKNKTLALARSPRVCYFTSAGSELERVRSSAKSARTGVLRFYFRVLCHFFLDLFDLECQFSGR